MLKSLLVSLTVVGLAAHPVVAQAQAIPATAGKAKTMKEMDHHEASSGWKELDAFHTVMAATWHTAAKDDLKPIREKASQLSDAAQKWAASQSPAACDTKPIRDAIAAVVAGSKDVASLVAKQAPDAEVKAALSRVHTRFEVVEEGCKPGHGEHKP